MKQGRIASLYAPFIDILIENLPRLSGTSTGSTKVITKAQPTSTDLSTNTSRTISAATNLTRHNTNGHMFSNVLANNSSSISISNGSNCIYATNFENGLHHQTLLNNDPLSVIAGVGKYLHYE